MRQNPVRPSRLTRRRTAGLATSVGVSAAAVAIAATLAWAAVHTRLESSVPAADEVLASVPDRFELTFSGPVNEALSTLVLVTPSGDSVRVRLRGSGADGRILVGDVPGLEDGEYLVRWRTVSADGHPVSGKFGFSFAGTPGADPGDEERVETAPTASPSQEGAPEVPAGQLPASDLPQALPGAVVVLLAGLGMVCLLGFAGLLWYCGSLPLLFEPRISRAVRVLGWSALLLLAADLIRWMVGVVPSGTGFAGVSAALGSGTGVAGLVRITLVAIALAALVRHGRAAAALAIAAVVVGAASGHAAAISPWITMPAKAVHLGAASIWFGGLLLLVLAPDGSTDGTGSWRFGSVARAVSSAALLSVILVVASGMVQSTQLVGEFGAYTGSVYGRGVLAKWGGLLVLVGFGAYHRFRLLPHLEEDGTGRTLRRTVRLETAVMLAVVMLAAWLARVSPPEAL
jgi:copper transport protein